MEMREQREDAIRTVWYRAIEVGNDPTQTDDYTAELILKQADDKFYRTCSDNQWKLFLRELHKRQKDEIAYQAYKQRRAQRMAK